MRAFLNSNIINNSDELLKADFIPGINDVIEDINQTVESDIYHGKRRSRKDLHSSRYSLWFESEREESSSSNNRPGRSFEILRTEPL